MVRMMTYVLDFLKNPLFLAPVLSWVAAQLTKLILQLVRRDDVSRLLTGGGMPSSHAATMFGLVVETGIVYGTAGFEFPMAVFFMVMVLFDAVNVRYITGEQNKVINRMVKDMAEDAANGDDTPENIEREKYYRSLPKFKELLGHTIPEVIVGAVIGTTVAVLVSFWN